MGFTILESITHAEENLLSQLRDGDIDLTGNPNGALLDMVDAVREILSSIEAQGGRGRRGLNVPDVGCGRPAMPDNEEACVYALIIDDSRAVRALLAKMMSDLGYQIDQAANGEEALVRLEANSYITLALVDWNMPVMNGLEFVRAVRAKDKWSHVLLVMVTTETELSNVVQALDAGANEYVMKPFTREVIAEKLGLLGIGTQ